MNETYVECMVKRKPSLAMKALYGVLVTLTVLLVLWGMVAGFLFLVIAGGFAALTYFAYLNSEIEYEYLYVDRQLSVDKVLNRSRRKKVASYDLERMEILAPIASYQLDSYKNRTAQVVDYSSHEKKEPDPRFALYYDGKTQIVFEPSPEMVKAIAMVAPRKVFKD
ncbi:MAG: DUF6106 family protein [Lachnospiraceae bacterium]|nr:DUF6106 family protein [Lachnospiraceae bacterium]